MAEVEQTSDSAFLCVHLVNNVSWSFLALVVTAGRGLFAVATFVIEVSHTWPTIVDITMNTPIPAPYVRDIYFVFITRDPLSA